jgi:excalibur calcium-binding domain-containing protein
VPSSVPRPRLLSSRTLSLRSAAVGLLAAVVLAGCAGESTKLKEQSLENPATTTSPPVVEETTPAAAPSSTPSAPSPSPSPKPVTPAAAPSLPVEATTAPPAPVAAIEEPPTSMVTYANCTAARDAGAAPLHIGDPGYSTKLDRDKDGVACE